MEQRVRRLPKPSPALAATLATAVVFGLALMIGWLTTGPREPLRSAKPVRDDGPAARLVSLHAVAPLPGAPKARAASSPVRVRPLPGKRGKLIVGSG